MSKVNQYSNSASRTGDLLAWEVEPNYTRGQRSVSPADDTDYPVGTLLADNAGTAEELAAGGTLDAIVLDGKSVLGGQTDNVLVLTNGPARIKASGIKWPAGITAPQQAAIEAQIAEKQIKIEIAVGTTN